MNHRYESVPTRTYQAGPVKTRANTTDWDNAPDWSLLTGKEVMALTGLSLTAIADRLTQGTFPKPGRDGKRRVWALGAIRAWCNSVAGEV